MEVRHKKRGERRTLLVKKAEKKQHTAIRHRLAMEVCENM